MLITVMAEVQGLTDFINHLIHDESCDAPSHYVHDRRLYQHLRLLFEERLLEEYLFEEAYDDDDTTRPSWVTESLSSIGEYHFTECVDQLLQSLGNLLATHEIVGILPLEARGLVLVVLTSR